MAKKLNPTFVGVRLTPAAYTAVAEMAEREGLTPTDIARRAIDMLIEQKAITERLETLAARLESRVLDLARQQTAAVVLVAGHLAAKPVTTDAANAIAKEHVQ